MRPAAAGAFVFYDPDGISIDLIPAAPTVDDGHVALAQGATERQLVIDRKTNLPNVGRIDQLVPVVAVRIEQRAARVAGGERPDADRVLGQLTRLPQQMSF